MNKFSCSCGCGSLYSNYRDQKNNPYDKVFVATLTSPTPQLHWNNEMYLNIFKKGIVFDGVRYKEGIYSSNDCPIISQVPAQHKKSIRRHVIRLNDADFREVKTAVRAIERSKNGTDVFLKSSTIVTEHEAGKSSTITSMVPSFELEALVQSSNITDENTVPTKMPISKTMGSTTVGLRTSTTSTPPISSSDNSLIDTIMQRLQTLEHLVEQLSCTKLKCTIHKDEESTIYCRHCSRLLCLNCMVEGHQNHEITSVKKITNVLTTEMQHENTPQHEAYYGWLSGHSASNDAHTDILVPLLGSPEQVFSSKKITDVLKLPDVFKLVPMSREYNQSPICIMKTCPTTGAHILDSYSVGSDEIEPTGSPRTHVTMAELCRMRGLSQGQRIAIEKM